MCKDGWRSVLVLLKNLENTKKDFYKQNQATSPIFAKKAGGPWLFWTAFRNSYANKYQNYIRKIQ